MSRLKIVLAPDSFKGSLSASGVCDAMEAGIRRVCPDAEIVKIPMADGGEGTVEALVSSTGGRIEKVTVAGPLGDPVEAFYGILGNSMTAVIEMAAASGLPLVPPEKRNPLKTTTYGTGQLMLAALEKGCRRLIIGIGGSATTDCGTGMAQALGVRFFRRDGEEISGYMNGERMVDVERIDLAHRHPLVSEAEITAACDVDNPLLGPCGSVYTYSRQKGATDEQLAILEANMESIIGVVETATSKTVRDTPGAGAAGGLGAGLMAFAGADLRPGIRLVLDACGFREKISGASLIFTGEGKVDWQTAFGKTISGVAGEAKQQSIPVIVIAGAVGDDTDELYDIGVTSLFSICSMPMNLDEAMKHADVLIRRSVERVMRLASVSSGCSHTLSRRNENWS